MKNYSALTRYPIIKTLSACITHKWNYSQPCNERPLTRRHRCCAAGTLVQALLRLSRTDIAVALHAQTSSFGCMTGNDSGRTARVCAPAVKIFWNSRNSWVGSPPSEKLCKALSRPCRRRSQRSNNHWRTPDDINTIHSIWQISNLDWFEHFEISQKCLKLSKC